MDAKRQTWERIKRDPKAAVLVKSDPDLQKLIGALVDAFGPISLQLDPPPGIKPGIWIPNGTRNPGRIR